MDSQSAISHWSSNKEVTIYAQPTVPSIPEGPDTGFTGTLYEYSTIAGNLNDTRPKYIFDWGDDTRTEIEHNDPDLPVTAQHIWDKPGTYEIKASVTTGTMTPGWSEAKYIKIFSTSSPTPSTPALVSPSDNDIVSGTSITFNWSKSIEATKYILEVNNSVTWAIAGRIYYVNLSTNEITLNDFPNNGTTYYWRVRAGNDKNWSSWSSIGTFLNINQPSKPALTSPENNEVLSTSMVTYKWSDTKGADRYLLEVNTQPTWTASTRKLYKIVGDVTEFTDTGYTFRDSIYYWRIRAGNDSEWSEWSIYNQFTQAAPLLTSPEDNEQVDGNTITFAWTPVSGITEYTLEINSDPGWDPYYCKFYQDVGNVKEYEITGFEQDGTRYYWRVRCGDMTNWIYSSETRSFVNTNVQVPPKPTITSPEDSVTVSGGSVTYKWNAEDKANQYFLEVNSDPNWNSKKWKLQKNVGDVTEYTDDGYLNDGTYYYWRVRAGNEAGWSEPAESFSFINFSLSAPVLSEPKDEEIVSGKSLDFKWKSIKDAEYYLLEVNTSETWNPKNRHFYKIVGNVTAYTVPDFLNDGTDYYWRVKVSNGSYWSAWSEPFSVTNGLAGTPSVPGLTSPAENASVAGNTVTYKWSTVSNANQYWLEVNTDPVTWSRKTRKFFGNVGDVQEYKDTGYSNDGTVYYWRVRAGNDVNWSTFSTAQYFTNWN
ncbi:MAG: fibronectin type III domain-containing protein [Dehalococcoidia bacterium]